MRHCRAFFATALVATSTSASALAAPTCPFSTFQEDITTQTFAPGLVSGWNNTLSLTGIMVNAGSWSGGEGFGTLDITKPFTKMAAAVAVVSWYHPDTWWGWHPNSEYFNEALPLASQYHNQSHWSYNDTNSGTEATTYYYVAGWQDGNTDFKCALFGNNGANTTSERAATMVHESWHQVLNDHGLNPHHMDGPLKQCTAGKGSCDQFFPHTVLDYLPGGESGGDLAYFRMSTGTTFSDHSLYHSCYQVGLEYACDLGQFSQPSIPIVTAQIATSIATGRRTSNFINIVGWVCGNPLPFTPFT